MITREKNVIRTYLIDYLKLIDPNFKVNGKKNLFNCPICKKDNTANVFPLNGNRICCLDPKCEFRGDIFDLVKRTKQSLAQADDDTIIEYLKHKLNIQIKDDTEEILNKYKEAGFALIPLKGGYKDPNENKKPLSSSIEWQKSEYKNPKIWHDWLERGYNIGLNLGKVSNVIALDIDDPKTYEKVKHMLGDTLIQTTKRGHHHIYSYEPDFDEINHANLRNKGYEMELRTNNAYIVIAPSSVDGEIREWNNKKIITMPKELKTFLLDLINKDKLKLDPDNDIQECINTEKISVVDLKGQRNDTFIKLLGILRKKLNRDQADFVATVISNNLIDKPIPRKELVAMLNQIEKYKLYDKKDLADLVLKRLDIIKEGTAFTIASTIKHEQKDVEEVLKYLEDENKIISGGGNKYRRLEQVEWITGFDDFTIPIDFEVPYFSKYARFDKGNMIIIGGKTGHGKTHIVGNIIKKLEEQSNVKSIDLITTEAGSKIGNILQTLKVESEFVYRPKKNIVKHPTEIELRDNSITIIDWLKPKYGDYAQTENTFEHLHNQLKKHSGFLIVFVQLRKSNGEFFAMDMIENYASLVAKYKYKTIDGKDDNKNTFFETCKIRDSRTGMQYITIPTTFDNETKILELQT